MTILIQCNCCKGKGTIKTNEGNPVSCPYCRGTKKRAIEVPHSSHRMQRKWRSEILAPAGTPRFYSVRNCIACKEEEWQSAAGHFLNGLIKKCAM